MEAVYERRGWIWNFEYKSNNFIWTDAANWNMVTNTSNKFNRLLAIKAVFVSLYNLSPHLMSARWANFE